MSSISKINLSNTDYTLNASSISDYNSSTAKIQVGFAGAGLTASTLGYVAGYTTDGTKIKDVNKAQMKSWLDLGSAAYANLNTVFNRHLYPSLGSTQTGNTPVWLLGLKGAGYPVYSDPEFASGTTVEKYANSGSENLTVTRGLATDFGIIDSGNSSGYVIQIKNTGTVVPGLGGFYLNPFSRANAIFIQIFRAMIPSGYSVQVASNPMGTSYQDTWLTSNAGTGKWEWYVRSIHCGSTGSFSSGGHVYLTGTTGTTDNPVIWYLSYCNCIDITKGNYDGLRTRFSDKLSTARNLKIGNTSKSFDGSSDVSWSLSEIGCLPLSGGTMSGDIKFNYNYGITLNTGTSWDDGYRTIPFSNVSDPSKIQWYSANATTGLTFNAKSGTLKTGGFQSESGGFIAPAKGSNPRTTYHASMCFYNCNPETTSAYNFGVYQWNDEFQFNYRTSATNTFKGNSFTIRGSDGLFCIVNRPVIGSYTSGKYVLHSGDVDGGGSTGGSSLTVYGKTLTIPTSLPASDVYDWAKASTKPSYSWSEITGKPSTFTPASHTHAYLPLSGGTMTGKIYRNYASASAVPFIHIGANNVDATMLRVYSSDGTETSNYNSLYGYSLIYRGSGSGINNRLDLMADNQTSTQVTAISVNNQGDVGIKTIPTQNVPLTVNGSISATRLTRTGNGSQWYYGRNSALVRTTSVASDGWNVITSLKTKNGDWSMGVLGSTDKLEFCYTTDTDFDADTNSTMHALSLDNVGNLTTNGSTTSSKFIKSGGTSSQFLKADGSVDSNSYSTTSHTHTKSQITDFPASLKNPTSLTVKLNSGTTEGTNLFTYDGSTAKTVNITPSAIGAATSGHTHSAYFPYSGGTFTGPISFNTSSLPKFSGAPPFILGIEAFADGGTLKWADADAVKVGTATTSSYSSYLGNSSTNYSYSTLKSALDGKSSTSHTHGYVSTVKVGSTSYSVSSNTITLPAYPTAASLGLSSAMKFIGTTTTALTDGAETNPITIGSTSVTATSGNVVLYGNKEFLWNGTTSKWEELGDESSHALKTVSIKAGTGLSGGGTLEADRTLSLSAATSSTLGGIKTGYTTSGKNYKVQLDSSNNAYVNVPWTDNNTTYNFIGSTFYSYNSNNWQDCNNCTTNGVYYYTLNGPSGITAGDGALYTQAYSTSWVGQIAQDYRSGHLFLRGKNNGSWTDWLTNCDSSNTYISSGTVYINGNSIKPVTSETSLSKGTTSGSGNAVTDISVSGHKITLTKDTTFLTSHQDISGKQDKSTAVTHTASTIVGSSTQPVYIASDGTATAIGYTIAKSVPSNAVFTDTNTTYSAGTGLTLSGTSFSLNTAGSALGGVKTTSTVTSNSGYTACPIIGGVPYYKDTNYDLSGYATQTWVTNKGYLTAHQDISGKSNTSHTHSVKINGTTKTIAASGGTAVDLGTYLTAHQDISGKADKASITAGTAGTSSATSGSSLSVPYVTVNAQGIVTGYGTHKHTISGFATSGHTHSYLPLSGGVMTGSIHSTFTSNTWVNSLTDSVITLDHAGYSGWICGPTKSGRICISTYPGSNENDNNLYFGYGETGRTTNSFASQMWWDGANNVLHAGTFVNTAGAEVSYNGHTHSQYLTSIPIASSSTLGGIKVGSNLSISSDGTLSATWRPIVDNLTSSTSTTSSLSAKQGYLLANGSAKDNNAIASLSASGTTITYTKRDGSTGTITTQDTNTNTAHTHTAGTGLSITGSGGTSGGVTYTLNKATASTIGGVRVGKTITSTSGYIQCPVDSNGTIYYQDTNTNTTYSAGNGLSLSGTTFSLDSSKPNIMFGVCETAGATPVKVCIIKNGDINLNDGTIVNIFFKYANTAFPDQTVVSFTTNADGSNSVNPMHMYSGYTSDAVAASPSYVDRVWGNIQFGTTYTFVIYNGKLYLLNDSNGAKAFNYCDTQITIDEFLTNVLGHGAAMGSFFLKTAFSANNVRISPSRYYYIFLPYRDGVANSSTDDTIVRGCLILVEAYIDATIYGKTGYYVYIDNSEVQKIQQFLPVTTTPAYGRCSTAAATAAKTVTVSNVTTLVAGTEITVYFSQKNTAANATLNVNNLGAINMRKAGNLSVGSGDLLVGVYKLVYNGSAWFII